MYIHIFVEGFMGFNMKSLFKICDKSFDLITVINIGIDLIKNIQVFHNMGFVHRDLKPDNLVYGPLCKENANHKNAVGIIDFGNSKLMFKNKGILNYSPGFYNRRGNKIFSSNNALLNKDTDYYDDIESIFYILVYFLNGTLPWKKTGGSKKEYSSNDIIQIRLKQEPEKLCYKFPKSFLILYKKIISRCYHERPDYSEILNIFKKIKNDNEKQNGEKTYRFKWLEIFADI